MESDADCSSYELDDGRRTAARRLLDLVGSKGPDPSGRIKAVNKEIGKFKRIYEEFMEPPVNAATGELRKDMQVSFEMPETIAFRFPHRDKKEQPWGLKYFGLLKGAKAALAVHYKKEGELILRDLTISFQGPSELYEGLWGPLAFGNGEAFPHFRIDKLVMTEALDKNGALVNNYTVKDYSGAERAEKVPYKVVVWNTIRDKESGERENCGLEAAYLNGIDVPCKCDGKNYLQIKYERQLNDIFKNMPKFALFQNPAGGLKAETYHYAEKVLGVSVDREKATPVMTMALVIWFLWYHGAGNYFPGGEIMDRVNELEEKVK